MEFARLRDLYNRCNPDEPLSPGDARNVDIDHRGVRGANWTAKLARQIELSKTPVCQIFTGLRGTGKSTEIQRLAAEGSDAAGVMTDGPLQRLWTWLSTTDVELAKISAGLELGAKVGADFNLKTNKTFRHQVREVVAKHLSTFVRFVHDELRELDVHPLIAEMSELAAE